MPRRCRLRLCLDWLKSENISAINFLFPNDEFFSLRQFGRSITAAPDNIFSQTFYSGIIYTAKTKVEMWLGKAFDQSRQPKVPETPEVTRNTVIAVR